MRHLLLALTLCVAGLACDRDRPVDTTADEAAVKAASVREIAFFTGAVDSLGAVVATDVIVMPPNEPALSGLAAVQDWTRKMQEQFTATATYPTQHITVSGDLAVEHYTVDMTMTPKAGGAAMHETGKGIHIYRRHPDGSWKIVRDVWNSDVPVAPAPAPTKK